MTMPLSQVLETIDRLTLTERWQVVDHVMGTLREETIALPKSHRSWLELEGIAERVTGEDAQDVVNQLRDEWDDREQQWREVG